MNLTVDGSTVGWGGYEKVIDVLEEAVTPAPWILGDTFSAADVMIGSDLYFGVRAFKLVASRPAFDAYIDRCMARPAFARAQELESDWT